VRVWVGGRARDEGASRLVEDVRCREDSDGLCRSGEVKEGARKRPWEAQKAAHSGTHLGLIPDAPRCGGEPGGWSSPPARPERGLASLFPLQFGDLVPRASVEGRAEGLRAFRVRAAAGS
jgi:hypothetical protein